MCHCKFARQNNKHVVVENICTSGATSSHERNWAGDDMVPMFDVTTGLPATLSGPTQTINSEKNLQELKLIFHFVLQIFGETRNEIRPYCSRKSKKEKFFPNIC